ncbi:MAG TPA: DUF4340 domain-containing protein [Vicinamibacterales bacterium]|nr:DUF4340 domain-containing protein [Vicinamibacterales bacterium]
MRGLRSTIALVVVLAGLGAYIYFVTWKTPETDTTKKQEKVFASVESDKIQEIKVTSVAGDATTLKKESGGWQLTEPLATKADESEVSGMASALSSVDIVRVVDENPTTLNDYGLSNPRIEVDFKAGSDKDYRKLFIGDKSPTGSDLFAKRSDDKKVFLIPAYQESTFNKTTFDLRDKVLLKFDRDKVDGIDVTSSGKSLAIAKDGTDWKIIKPLAVRADFGSVEGLVGRLQSAQMKSIVTSDPTPADLKKYGLDKPEVTVNLNAGSSRATLMIGGKAENNTVYAKDASKPAVVTVESTLADDLKKSSGDYRRKDLFEFRAYNAGHIELTRGDQTVVFEKVKGTGGQSDTAPDKWRRISPSAADADKDKIDSLLTRLANMRASSFVDSTTKTGLDKPALAVYVKFDDGKKEERVTFGKVDNDVYASHPGEPGAAKADSTDFTEAMKSLDELAK